jgi:hypothetical protein
MSLAVWDLLVAMSLGLVYKKAGTSWVLIAEHMPQTLIF